MADHIRVAELVGVAYRNSPEPFAQWMWQNHVPVVAKKTEELALQFNADVDIAVAGAWLHDFGDVFVHRHAADHEDVSKNEAVKILKQANYSEIEIEKVLQEVIAPHSCRDGFLPTTLEGKVMATADALAHLTTNFYVQFAWKHLPENKTFAQFIAWVTAKIERDFHTKIFFDEIKEVVRFRYDALKEIFVEK